MTLRQIFDSFNSLKVLIVGDVMVDAYSWGKVDRISPEAPVPVVHVQRTEKRLGGAANVAINVKALGAKPILCGVIGADYDGRDFGQLMQESELPDEGILVCKSRPTTVKHRILSGSQQMLRVDSEVDQLISTEEKAKFLENIALLLPTCDVVIFEDYDKGVLDKEVISKIIGLARQRDIPTIVDPKKRNFLHYKQATLFKPNLKELKEGLKVDFNVNKPEELEKVVDLLKSQLQVEGVLTTLSEKGVFIDFHAERHHLPAHIRQISDVSGAGDTVVSIAALCLALRLPPQFIAGIANLGGGLVCEFAGVVPINKQSLYEEALQNNFSETLLL
jgi:rfaE bifunctional protein kinase chain/domain